MFFAFLQATAEQSLGHGIGYGLEFPKFGYGYGEDAPLAVQGENGLAIVKDNASLKAITSDFCQLAKPFGILAFHTCSGFDFNPPDFPPRLDDNIHFSLIAISVVVETWWTRHAISHRDELLEYV